MLGRFPQIKLPEHRRYIRAYWRYLVGWSPKQPPRTLAPAVEAELRRLAKDEVINYRLIASAQGGAVVYSMDNGYEPPPATPNAAIPAKVA